MVLVFASPAAARLYFTFEVREAFEDNVVASVIEEDAAAGAGQQTTVPGDDTGGATDVTTPTDDGRDGGGNGGGSGKDSAVKKTNGLSTVPVGEKQGDFATELYADIGYIRAISDKTALLVQASVDHTTYVRFGEFDYTIGALRAGGRHRFTEIFSARLTLNGKAKRYVNRLRSSFAYGATLSLRQDVTPSFWLRESVEYEKNNADSRRFSYHAGFYGLKAGYALTNSLLAGAGYGLQVRDYEPPEPRKITSRIVSADLTKLIGRRWSVIVAYDREENETTETGATFVNNIYAIGIQYGY
jgi:hypothetical protein